MLESMRIKNVALIEESEIDFEKGLNILSGETGAGKSMIIDSLNFALGERVGKDFLRKGEKNALVEVLFNIKDKDFLEKLSESGIEPEEDGSVLITRTMSASGKSVCRINGCMVTMGMLKELSECLIDIHGQHEHQSLLNPSRHIRLLDQFCGEALEEKKQAFQNSYQRVKQLEKDLTALLGDEQQRARKVDLLLFQTQEIENAYLHIGEEEELLERRKLLANGEKLLRLTAESLELLYDGTAAESAAFDKLAQALNNLRELAAIDESTEEIYETMDSLYAQMDDCVRELKHYGEQIDVNPQELEQVEERLQEIYGLKRKYGGSIEEILTFYNGAKKELDFLDDSEETALRLEKEQKKAKVELNLLADEMSHIRRKKAKIIEKEIETQLKELEMKSARFRISVEERVEMTANGKDKVEFLISANAGEEMKPLAKIASGGEMSRVMLALKTVLAQADTIETFIFDEIDTGVSGRTAQRVAEKMSLIGRSHQIICITHLPQIAAMADCHFLIEKKTVGDRTVTDVFLLDGENSAEEIARLIGGVTITNATLTAARELKEQAKALRKEKKEIAKENSSDFNKKS